MTKYLPVDTLDRKERYDIQVQQAFRFAGDSGDLAWNGLFLMGLTIAGLELIPVTSLIERPFYWIKAPSPFLDPENPDHPDWEASWIAERDAFHLEPPQE